MRDHQLGYPPATMAVEPAPAAPRYPLGRPTRDPEPQTWPFPLVKPAVTFVADSRTPASDKPKPVVLGVDMGSHESDQFILMRNGSAITFVSGGPVANVAPGCFGVWRKTPPQPNVELQFRSPWTGEIKSKWPGPQSGWADGWEWFDASAEPEKPAQVEPQFKVGDRVVLRYTPFISGMYGIVQAINHRVVVEWRRESGEVWCELNYESDKLERA